MNQINTVKPEFLLLMHFHQYTVKECLQRLFFMNVCLVKKKISKGHHI